MSELAGADLQELLDDCVAAARVPGAVLAVLEGDRLVEVASGTANVDTAVPTTTDTLFFPGSVVKVYTATVVMRFVDQGIVDLDAPVRSYLPQLRFADDELTEVVTIRQLLNHTNGIDGEYFPDLGPGDASIARYVDECAKLPRIHAPGELMSYCNAGYVILGRLIEVLTGLPWGAAMRRELFDPLGLTHTALHAEEAILKRAAAGHIVDPGTGQAVVFPSYGLPHCLAPAGSKLSSSVGDMVRIGALHIRNGVTERGERVLSEDAVAAMQRPETPVLSEAREGVHAWGLGWFLLRWGDTDAIGHDGGNIGQPAYLRLVPDRDVAVGLMCNGLGPNLGTPVLQRLFRELYGIDVPQPPTLPEQGAPDVDLSAYVGVYARLLGTFTFAIGDGGLTCVQESRDPTLSALGGGVTVAPPAVVRPIDRERFLFEQLGGRGATPVRFYDLDADGRPGGFHMGFRAIPRAS